MWQNWYWGSGWKIKNSTHLLGPKEGIWYLAFGGSSHTTTETSSKSYQRCCISTYWITPVKRTQYVKQLGVVCNVLHGTVVGPLISNIYKDGILSILDEKEAAFCFVDDTVLIVQGGTGRNYKKAQMAIWWNKCWLSLPSLNVDKTKLITCSLTQRTHRPSRVWQFTTRNALTTIKKTVKVMKL